MKHFEILVEDASGGRMLEIILPFIVSSGVTYRVHSYRGIGHLPKDLRPGDVSKRRLLFDQLPRLLRGYNQAFSRDAPEYSRAVVLVCDLDSMAHEELIRSLENIKKNAAPNLEVYFWIAIEEGEAWLLGDRRALLRAYPKAKRSELDDYIQDSICGTWEKLADVVYPGGARRLKARGYPEIGLIKMEWASNICQFFSIDENRSPSFKAGLGIF